MELPPTPAPPRLSKFDISLAISKALDMVNAKVVDHQKRVALIAAFLAEEAAHDGIALSTSERHDLILAALLHDIGAVSVVERLKIAAYDTLENRHAEIGANFLRNSRLFRRSATLVRYHHASWRNGMGATVDGKNVPIGSHIICLADRVEVSIDMDLPILDQTPAIVERIRAGSGKRYHPALVDSFTRLAQREAFWLDIVSPDLDSGLRHRIATRKRALSIDELLDIAHMFAVVIDLRSKFTATHSFGVAATAAAIGRAMGLDETHCRLIEVAGYMHDLGKLIVPQNILEKPGTLSKKELNKVRTHTYYTFAILSEVPEMRMLGEWAAYHHEQINGAGYPFHLSGDRLSLEARIMSIADKFVALAEDRPYRPALSGAQVQAEMNIFVDNGMVDREIVDVLFAHFDEIDDIRKSAQLVESKIIDEFRLELPHARTTYNEPAQATA